MNAEVRQQVVAAWVNAGAACVQAVGAIGAIIAAVSIAVRAERRAAAAEQAAASREIAAQEAADRRLREGEQRAADDRARVLLEERDALIDLFMVDGERLRGDLRQLKRDAERMIPLGYGGVVSGDISTPTSLHIKASIDQIRSKTRDIELIARLNALEEAATAIKAAPQGWSGGTYHGLIDSFAQRANEALDAIAALRSS